jgi:hypothetical protein
MSIIKIKKNKKNVFYKQQKIYKNVFYKQQKK